MLATVEQVESDLLYAGLPLRYRTSAGTDGLAGHEHPFLGCAIWLGAQYAYTDRLDDATVLMTTLAGYANEVGLQPAGDDPPQARQRGHFPQAFSHLGLVRAADALHEAAQARQSENTTDTPAVEEMR